MALFRRISNPFSGYNVEREIDVELPSRIDMWTADNVAAGMLPEAARIDALLKFGNPAAIKERVTAVDSALAVKRIFRDFHRT